jgi:hypothetical protein
VPSLIQDVPNAPKHTIHFVEDLIVPEPQHCKSGTLEKFRTRSIGRDRIRVLPAIQFNDQPSFKADEIENVVAEWVLATKLAAA